MKAHSINRSIACALAFFAASATTVRAQGSLYVPLDDIAYRYADALIARGELHGVSLLERPYTALQLEAGADAALGHRLSPVMRSYALALRTALQRYAVSPGSGVSSVISEDGTAHFAANMDIFVNAQTSGQKQLTQPDTVRSITGGGGMRVAMVAGPAVLMVRPIIDNNLNDDPDFSGRKDRAIAGRTEDAYVAGQWQYAELFAGRIARNWGPSELQGMQVGSAPYTYDHIYAKIGNDRVHVASIFTKLDDSFEQDGVHARYFYAHRLGVRFGNLELGANEGFIASGIGRSFDLQFVNPANIYALSWRNERQSGNLSLGGTIAYRSHRYGNLSSELFIDDLQIDKCGTVCHEPSSYGVSATVEGFPLYGDQKLFASYSRLTGLAYRTPEPAEQYSSAGIGLGQRFSDYDEARIGIDAALIPYATIRVYGAYRRQGQGDYHLPYPDSSQYAFTKGFLQGTVEHLARVGLEAGYMIAPGLELTTDVGVDHATNFQNLLGATRTLFAGRARLQWTTRSLTF